MLKIQDLIETCKLIVEEYDGFTLTVSEGDKDFYTLFLLGNGNIYSLRAGTTLHIMKLAESYKVVCTALNLNTTSDDLPTIIDKLCDLMSHDNKEV